MSQDEEMMPISILKDAGSFPRGDKRITWRPILAESRVYRNVATKDGKCYLESPEVYVRKSSSGNVVVRLTVKEYYERREKAGADAPSSPKPERASFFPDLGGANNGRVATNWAQWRQTTGTTGNLGYARPRATPNPNGGTVNALREAHAVLYDFPNAGPAGAHNLQGAGPMDISSDESDDDMAQPAKQRKI